MPFSSLRLACILLSVAALASCVTAPAPPAGEEAPLSVQALPPMPPAVAPPVLENSRWMPASWSELAGFNDDDLAAAWNAWLHSCERPPAAFASLCPQIRQLSIASESAQRQWILDNMQPWRVESPEGQPGGLLTAYYEPVFTASRLPDAQHTVALYAPPSTLDAGGKPWFSRAGIETSARARAALHGRALAWLADPVDAMILHIQGSGRLIIREPDGSTRTVRMAFAATNGHPYRSVARWLLERGLIDSASWDSIRTWARQNPQLCNAMLQSNPRFVFFREEPLEGTDLDTGPRGAQGVPLTPGRSIAVDRRSIPYGTPVWLVSSGEAGELQRLVLAQDTGAAIVGAVRADYFTGWGQQAGEQAGRFRQDVRLWALWPKNQLPPQPAQ